MIPRGLRLRDTLTHICWREPCGLFLALDLQVYLCSQCIKKELFVHFKRHLMNLCARYCKDSGPGTARRLMCVTSAEERRGGDLCRGD